MATEDASYAEHAYNTQLWGYDHGLRNRSKCVVIKVGKLSKPTDVDSRIKAVQDAYGSEHRPALEPDNEELVVGDALLLEDPNTAVFVGVRPSMSFAKKKDNSTIGYDAFQKALSKGSSVNSLGEKRHIEPYESKALRVVAPRFKTTATYYALTKYDAETKRCEGVLIGTDEVFFFPEFRDDNETATDGRRLAWSKLVRTAAGQTEGDQRKEIRAKGATKFVVQETRSLSSEIEAAMAKFQITGSKMYLDKAKAVVEALTDDMQDKVLTSNLNICKLFDIKETMEDADLENAFKEIEAMWPDLSEEMRDEKCGGAVSILRRVSDGLRLGQYAIPYEHVRMYLATATFSCRDYTADYSDAGMQELANLSRWRVRVLVGDGKPPPAGEPNPSALLMLFEHTAKLLEAHKTNFDAKLKHFIDSQGGRVSVAASIPDLWEMYGRAPDTDTAKYFLTQMHHFNVNALAKVFADIPAELAEAAKDFRELVAELEGLPDAGEGAGGSDVD